MSQIAGKTHYQKCERRSITNKMATILQSAKDFVPKSVKNIADLQTVSVDIELHRESATDTEGKEFSYNFIEVGKEKYRIPDKVLNDLKAILEKKPNMKTFSVTKKGSGLSTQYTVIPGD